MVGFPLAGWRVGLDYQSLSHLFSNRKQARGVSIGSPIVRWLCLPVWHSRRFLLIRNGRESPLIGEPDSVAPPPVVADLIETVLLWFFSSLFMDSMKHGLGPESLQTHFFLS